MPLEFIDRYLKDIGLNAGLVLLLTFGIFILWSRPLPSDHSATPRLPLPKTARSHAIRRS